MIGQSLCTDRRGATSFPFSRVIATRDKNRGQCADGRIIRIILGKQWAQGSAMSEYTSDNVHYLLPPMTGKQKNVSGTQWLGTRHGWSWTYRDRHLDHVVGRIQGVGWEREIPRRWRYSLAPSLISQFQLICLPGRVRQYSLWVLEATEAVALTI